MQMFHGLFVYHEWVPVDVLLGGVEMEDDTEEADTSFTRRQEGPPISVVTYVCRGCREVKVETLPGIWTIKQLQQMSQGSRARIPFRTD